MNTLQSNSDVHTGIKKENKFWVYDRYTGELTRTNDINYVGRTHEPIVKKGYEIDGEDILVTYDSTEKIYSVVQRVYVPRRFKNGKFRKGDVLVKFKGKSKVLITYYSHEDYNVFVPYKR